MELLLNKRYPRPSLEDVIKRNPDVIVIMALSGNIRIFERMKEKWKEFSGLKAVRNKQIYILEGDSILRPTLRILEGLSKLEKIVFNDEFKKTN